LFHAGGRAGGQADMKKLIAIFLNFGNPPGNGFAVKFSEAFCALFNT
jgi:hypothetical protein